MDTTQSLYLQSVLTLANTLTVKFPMAAKMRNAFLASVGYTVDQDKPETWAYHMNIAGKYHASDTLMQVTSIDTLETIDFTYDNLQIHRATAAAYVFGTNYYNQLVKRYPRQETLIRGILNPVDIATVVAAADYEILYYDKSLVEDQEVYLIQDLQTWIYGFFARYYRPFPAAVQLYYPAAFFAVMTSHIPGEIMNLRDKYSHTPHVHSYHLWSYLGSFNHLNAFQDYTSLRQALYLYRNIAYIEAHVGQNTTFVDLVANILTNRRIPLTSYQIRHDVTDVGEKSIYSTATIAKIPENSLAQSVTGLSYITVETALDNEVNVAKDNVKYLDEQKVAVPSQAKNTITNTLPSKVLESIMVDQSDSMPHKFADTLLAEWIFLSTAGKYVANISIQDSITQDNMSMTVKEALILWIYCVMKQFELEPTVIPNLTAFFAQRIPKPTFSELRGVTDEKYVSELQIQAAMTEVTNVTQIVSTDAFYNVAISVQNNITAHRLFYSATQDYMARGQMQLLCDRFYMTKQCQLIEAGTTFAQWLETKNWNISATSTDDFSALALEIFTVATGSDLRTNISVSDIHTAMISIMTQLSSYSVQYIHKTDAAPGAILDNVAIRFGTTEVKGSGGFRVPARVEIINQFQQAYLSPEEPSFRAIELNVAKISTDYFFAPSMSVGFNHNSNVATTHRFPIAAVRFRGNLATDLALDIKYTALNGLYVYRVQLKTIDEVIDVTRLPGLYLYPPETEDLIQTDILIRNLSGLNTFKFEPDPSLSLTNADLDGLAVRKIPYITLDDLFETDSLVDLTL